MNLSAFRHHLRRADDPRIAGIEKLDAFSHAERMLAHPLAGKLFSGWRRTYETSEFRGITTDGHCAAGLFTLGDENAPVRAAVDAADALLKTLDDDQRRKLCHTADAREWHAWMNPEVYMMRFGLRMEEVGLPVRDAILDLLGASLSAEGFERVRNLMRVNHFLGELVNATRVLNEYSYNLNLFGTPSLTEPWGWNFYGHHICLNCRFVSGQMVVTPLFMGAEPNSIDSGSYAGLVIFEQEERLGLELIRSLRPDLQEKAQLYKKKRDPAMPPGRVALGDELTLGGAFQDNRVIPYEGACVADFEPSQQAHVMELVARYLAYLPDGPRASRLQQVAQHLQDTHFCWIGGFDDTSAFYYRIQSPVIVVEFDHHAGVFLGNTEPEKFHIHTLVRTPNGNDYGMEVVRLHCECQQRIRLTSLTETSTGPKA
jgi:hypothetical protein